MIFPYQDAKPVQALPGIIRRTLATSPKLMICEFTFDANVEVPIHTHPHEQVGYVVYGRAVMNVDGVKRELQKGDSYYAPSNIPHGVVILEPTMIVDTFTPPREDYR